MDALQEQIEQQRATLKTDFYPMSIGEVANMYLSDPPEIDIHPDFQRIFRWKEIQKTKLIESILLGIPIPPIFVAQRSDGIWDVVDGVQRLSTIFQFMGILKDENGKSVPPFEMTKTKYLPALEGRHYESDNPTLSLSSNQRINFKRAKLHFNIILQESTENTKYELFQRLNTGGSQLSDQEVRNCLLIMVNKQFYNWLVNLSRNQDFINTTSLSERALEERYDLDLILRYLIFRNIPESELKDINELNEFMTEKMMVTATEFLDYNLEEEIFREVFHLINNALGVEAFRRFNKGKMQFQGAFSVSAFEAVTTGLGYNRALFEPSELRRRVENLWIDHIFSNNSGSGVRASTRIQKIVPLARQLFSK